MTTVRLDDEIERRLEMLASRSHRSKSEVIKTALLEYFEQHPLSENAYAVGEDLFGVAGSGRSNGSQDYKRIVKERLREKHTH
jgi:predicted transcriptional regulator